MYDVINNLNMVDEDELAEEVLNSAIRRGSNIDLKNLMVSNAQCMHICDRSARRHVTSSTRSLRRTCLVPVIN